MSDDEMLEKLTGDFVKNLINHKFQDKAKYTELANRVCHLINAEVIWQSNEEYNRFLMNCWGSRLN